MPSPPKHLVLIAGEASGDLHGAHLVAAIKEITPSTVFSGLGGPQMEARGVHLYDDLTKLAVVGFWEVLKHYRDIRQIFHHILNKIEAIKPAAVILIDYPGFNLRLAKELKKRHIKVIYYISPQVWAWKKNRVYAIQNTVDKMLVIFPFEKEFYSRFNIDVACVGHPLVDVVKPQTPKNKFLKFLNFSDEHLTIALLPGSRQKEIENLLPAMLCAADILNKEFSEIQK